MSSLRGRQIEAEGRAPSDCRSNGDAAVVRGDDRRDDREPEADAAARARARRVGAVEALEDALGLLGGPGPGPRRRPRARASSVEPRAAPSTGVPGRRVRADVREQVVDKLPQPLAVAEDDAPARSRGRDRPRRVDRARGVDGLARRPRRARPARARAAGPRRAARAAAGRRRAGSSAPTRARIPPIARARSSGRSSAPRAKSSAYARTAASGVRSSCDASATKRRSLRSDASFALKALSIWPSIAFSASPSRPTSVRSSARSTRRERSPAAIAAAVAPIASSGRRPRRTTQRPSAASAASTAPRDEQLDQEQPAQRRVDVLERAYATISVAPVPARPRRGRGSGSRRPPSGTVK